MILIVDDRQENIVPLRKILELHNFETDSAESGEEALKKVLKKTYSLIILDVQMPGMDGFEVAEAISGYSKAKDTPIIFLSAVSREKKFITQGYVSGGIDYITKPVDPDILLLKVKTFHKLYEQHLELKNIQKSLRSEIETRKQAEKALVGRMQELQGILESLPLVAFTIAASGQIEFVNGHWYQYSSDPLKFPKVHPDDAHEFAKWEACLAAGKEFIGEMRLRNIKTMAYNYFMVSIVPIRQNGIIMRWVGTFNDINQQKADNEILEQKVTLRTAELLSKNLELEATNHELQQFSWVVSHDLKEPLRKIQTFNNLIKDKYLEPGSDAIPLIDKTISASNRLGNLINDLLNYARLSVVSSFEPVDINLILNELMFDFDDLIREKNVVVHIEEFPEIEAIPTQIRQVFQNLFSNALKFSRPGILPELNIRSEYIAEKEIDAAPVPYGPFLKIVFSDNGIGFDTKYLDKIFVIFQRLNEFKNYEGTGIGLAIVKKIIDKHNGLVSAQSAENEGASFIIILPVKQKNIQSPTVNHE